MAIKVKHRLEEPKTIVYDVYGEEVVVSMEGDSPDIDFIEDHTIMSFRALNELRDRIMEDFDYA